MSNRFMAAMALSVLIASLSQVLLKKSAGRRYASAAQEYLNPYVICGYGLLFASMLLTVYAYSGMDFKNGPVLEAFGNVLVLVFGRIFFRERITKGKLAGIVCIVAGMVIFYL